MSLTTIYDNPRTTTNNYVELAKRAHVSENKAKHFLKKQAVNQIDKIRNKPDEKFFAPTGDRYGTYEVDTIYLRDEAGANDHHGAILICLEANTRYAYGRPLTMKADAKKRGVSAEKTTKAFKSILEENHNDQKKGIPPILFVRCDNGPELKEQFTQLLNDRNIPVKKIEARTHERMARLDRFVLSLRWLIKNHFVQNNTHRWIDVLQDLITNYNTRKHRILKKSPSEMTHDDVKIVRKNDLLKARAVRELTDKSEIKEGSQVRLYNKRRKEHASDRFLKAHIPVWSDEVYNVEKRAGPNSFTIDTNGKEAKVWPIHSLQLVPKNTKEIKKKGVKVDKKIVRQQRALYQEIDGEELEANLKAPAREKRADRIDYKKLSEGEGRELKTNTRPKEIELTAEQSEPVEKTKKIPKEKNVEPVELRRSTRERKAPKRYE